MKDAAGQTVSLRIAGTSSAGERGGVRRVGHGDHLPRLPRRLRGEPRRATRRRRRRRRAPPAERRRGRRGGAEESSSRRATRRTRRRATRRRRSCARSRSSASGARRRTRRSSARSSTAATSSRRARRSSRRSSRSRSSRCSSSTSAGWSTTASPRAWRTTSTGSPPATRSASSGCAASTSASGDGNGPARARLRPRRDRRARDQLDRRSATAIVLRVGRYGPYLERDEQRANVPDDLVPDELTVEKAEELLAQPSGDRELGVDPETGRADRRAHRPLRPVRDRGARGGLEGEAADRVALQVDVARHRHPRRRAAAAVAPARPRRRPDGEEVTARNGRYGPYVQQGKESRSLESEEQLFTIDARRGARAARAAEAAPRRAPGRSRR